MGARRKHRGSVANILRTLLLTLDLRHTYVARQVGEYPTRSSEYMLSVEVEMYIITDEVEPEVPTDVWISYQSPQRG